MKWGAFDEQPTPETTTVRDGSTFISVRAIWTALRIPKSPHPGHQSLCAVVFRSESLSAMFQHQFLGGVPLRDQLDRVVDLLGRHRPSVVLYDQLPDRDARPLAQYPNQLSRIVHLD